MTDSSLPSESQAARAFELSRYRVILTGGLVFLLLFPLVAYFIRPSVETVILRYNAFFGVDILGVWWQAYLIPGICLVFFSADVIIAHILFRRRSFLPALIFLYGSLLIALSGVIATATLLFINS